MKVQERQVMGFYKTEGFHDNSLPAGLEVIEDLGKENSFIIKHTNKGEGGVSVYTGEAGKK